MKNLVYIQQKEEKLQAEIREMQYDPYPQILGFKFTIRQDCFKEFSRREAKRRLIDIKKYQLWVLQKIKGTDYNAVFNIMQKEARNLCPACQEGIENGQAGCSQDLYRFLMVDMIRRSLQ